MHLIQLRTKVDDEQAEHLVGKRAHEEDIVVLVRENATVFKPNGQRLVTLIRGGVSEEAKAKAYPFLHGLRKHASRNRGAYGGEGREFLKKKDGTLSHTTVTPPISSVIAGYFDSNPRFPFCRETAFSTQNPIEWRDCFPMIRETARLFEQHVPDRYKAQHEAAMKTHPAYIIPETPYTTLTINNCVAGGYHRDAGDYKAGCGVIAVFRKGNYNGCRLNFAQYGVAVDLQDRDVILFDPHEIHGNTPFADTVGEQGEDWERISVVFYFREKMLKCKSPAEELENAKRIRGGDFEMPTPDTEPVCEEDHS